MNRLILLILLIVLLGVIFYPKTKKDNCVGFEKKEVTHGPLYQNENGVATEARFEYTCFGLTY